jgi:hypothetical protein
MILTELYVLVFIKLLPTKVARASFSPSKTATGIQKILIFQCTILHMTVTPRSECKRTREESSSKQEASSKENMTNFVPSNDVSTVVNRVSRAAFILRGSG